MCLCAGVFTIKALIRNVVVRFRIIVPKIDMSHAGVVLREYTRFVPLLAAGRSLSKDDYHMLSI